MVERMLILPGIKDIGDGHPNPNGLLDRDSAREYARRRGYVGKVLDVSGEASSGSRQSRAALSAIRDDGEITALYGFSGGGYNARHVLGALDRGECARIKLVVILGAPSNPPALYETGPWELVYRTDPPRSQGGHMGGPKVLLAELGPEAPLGPTGPTGPQGRPVPAPWWWKALAALGHALATLLRGKPADGPTGPTGPTGPGR